MARTTRTTTRPQAPKVDHRNIVCSGHGGKIWRKEHTRDRNAGLRDSRTKVDISFRESEDRTRASLLEQDLREQMDCVKGYKLDDEEREQKEFLDFLYGDSIGTAPFATATTSRMPKARMFRVRKDQSSDYRGMPNAREHPLGLRRPAFC